MSGRHRRAGPLLRVHGRSLAGALLPTLLWACASSAQTGLQPSAAGAEEPTLIVALVVDQLRGDLLGRYDDLFEGGLRRVLDSAHQFTNANHRHAVTATAPGHASLSTGVFPSRSGVVSNSWFEQAEDGTWRSVYAVEDSASAIVGFPDYFGRSPRNLMREGLADWVRAADERAQVVSLSRKDRAAVTMAGQARGHVYWMLPEVPTFTTSAYYRDSLPPWVERFNQDVLVPMLADTVWESRVPSHALGRSRGDTASYEGDGTHTWFPHRYAQESREGTLSQPDWAAGTPWPDAATLALAREAVRELDLGGDEAVDYLGLALSQTDLVGHGFGPLSREQLDNLLHLDRELGSFLEFLDEEVGPGRWVLGLSADHGVLTMPEYLAETGEDGARLSAEDIEAIRSLITEATARAAEPDLDRWVADRARDLPFAEAAYAYRDLAEAVPADSFAVLYQNSYYDGRVTGPLGRFGVEVRSRANLLFTTGSTGTSHGSPYWYDRWVPLAFVGPGVEAATEARAALTVDFAPTLARLAGIPVPRDLDGQALLDPP